MNKEKESDQENKKNSLTDWIQIVLLIIMITAILYARFEGLYIKKEVIEVCNGYPRFEINLTNLTTRGSENKLDSETIAQVKPEES